MASCTKHGEHALRYFACPKCFKNGNVDHPLRHTVEEISRYLQSGNDVDVTRVAMDASELQFLLDEIAEYKRILNVIAIDLNDYLHHE